MTLNNLPTSVWMMRGVSGGWALPVLLFFSIPFAHEAESISLSKKMSTAELMYADQLLNAEQYARWCEYQNTPDPSTTSIIYRTK